MAERQLQTPHGGELVDLMAPAGEHAALKAACTKSIELSDRNACDVELLTVGCGLTGDMENRSGAGRTGQGRPLDEHCTCTDCDSERRPCAVFLGRPSATRHADAVMLRAGASPR